MIVKPLPNKPTNPDIDVVIIGLNSAGFLADCIKAVQASDYPQGKLHIIYADGGSTDNSVQTAGSFPDVQTVELNLKHPTPGSGRNGGYRVGTSTLVQFIDSDTILTTDWISKAVTAFQTEETNLAAVTGVIKEKFPAKNLYHVIAGIEWRYPVGYCNYFGGNTMVRREFLNETTGYDEGLVAGEDPDLSYRIRALGGKIIRLPDLLGIHDINMHRFKQYWKRSFRSGHAYAELALRYMNKKDKLWMKELFRIALSVFIPIGLLVLAGVPLPYFYLFAPLGILFIFRSFRSFFSYKKKHELNFTETLAYCLHLSAGKFIQLGGVVRYFYGTISGNKLTNQAPAGAK